MLHTRRGLAEVVNQKAYSVALAASKITKKAEVTDVVSAIGVVAREVALTKPGAKRRTRGGRAIYAMASHHSAPLAAVILNARRGRRGRPGLYGADMRRAIHRMVGARKAATGFVRAGWLVAVARLARAIGRVPRRDALRWMSRTRAGGANPARTAGFRVQALLWHQLVARRRTVSDVPGRLATEGLRIAMAQEVVRMHERIEAKMREVGRQSGI